MKKLLFSIVLVSLLLVFSIKLYFIHPSFSDENIYYAMGKALSEGQKPYFDFNFVHPPIQLYLLSAIFKTFGPSLIVAKILPLAASSLSVILMFLISKKLFDERSAFVSSFLFFITPAFLAFSDQGYGIWETLLFILLSLYLSLKQKYLASGITFSLAIFIRYLSALFFPLILIILIFNKLRWKKFLFYSVIFSIFFLISFYLIYGFNFIDQTVLFQFFAKSNYTLLPKLPFQYLALGFFSIFLSVVCLVIGLMKKEKLLIVFSLYPLLIDGLIFFGFTTIIYHYFLISLSFLFIGLGKSFTVIKDRIVQIGIVAIVLVSLYHNFPTVDYYQDPSRSQYLFQIADYVSNRTFSGEKIFGESSITTFIMFTKGIPISYNYLDSFLSYLIYRDEKSVIANLEKEQPKVVIDMNSYYENNPTFRSYLSEKYQREKIFPGIPTYIVYTRK
ncbi:MAG: glycosyltransferase family 39 protein [Candidatus Aenigmarchaeota archaeon]|nr:glycosyltransferase family 39 protein [Candidatus Aenigmarchaeota archaeon]